MDFLLLFKLENWDVSVFQKVFPLVGWTFKNVFENWVVAVILQNSGGNLQFLNTRNVILMTTPSISSPLTTLSLFDILIYMGYYQSYFRPNQRWISAVQRWEPNVLELRKSTLNSAESELNKSETALNFAVVNSADSEKIRVDQIWNSALQRWSSLRLQPK